MLTPFINELHYDNSGTDTNEFVEIAGNSQSLLGYRLVLYNGGTGTRYRSVSLQEEIPDQDNGFGAIAVFINGLQNGPADGIALVDAMDQVLDWLSYEGQLLAIDGPAMGLLSDSLPVFEAPSTASGLSLQRTGRGQLGGQFDWVGPLAQSAGAINFGQQFLPTVSVDEPQPLPLLALGLSLIVLAGRSRGANHVPLRPDRPKRAPSS